MRSLRIETRQVGGGAVPQVVAFVIVCGVAVRIFGDPGATVVTRLPDQATEGGLCLVLIDAIAPVDIHDLVGGARSIGGHGLDEEHVITKGRVFQYRKQAHLDLIDARAVLEHVSKVLAAHVPGREVHLLDADAVLEHLLERGNRRNIPIVDSGDILQEHALGAFGLLQAAGRVGVGNTLVVLAGGEHARKVAHAGGVPVSQTIERGHVAQVLKHVGHGDHLAARHRRAQRPLANLAEQRVAQLTAGLAQDAHIEHA